MPLPAILGALGRVAAVAGRAGVARNVAGPVSSFVSRGQALADAGDATGKFVGALAKLPAAMATAPITGFTAALTAVQAPALAVTGALHGMKSTVTALGDSVAGFVKSVSPAHVERFNYAVEDMTASIGRALLPVMEFATAMTRKFGDVLFTVSGKLQNVFATLSGPMTRVMDALFNPLVSVLESIIMLATPAVEALAAMVDGWAVVFKVMGDGTTALLRAVGLASGTMMSSVGAAVRAAGVGSVEDYGRRAQVAAFRLGTGAEPAERSANMLEQIRDMLNGFFNGLPRELAKLPVDVAQKLAEALAKFLPGGGAVGRAVDAGERRAGVVMRRIDRAHDRAVNAVEDTLGVELPSANPLNWIR